MLADGDLELRDAYSEVISVGVSVCSADSLDAVRAAVDKGVEVLAGRGQASLPHYAVTVSVVTALWLGVIVLSQEFFVPGVILSQSWWGHNQTQHEDQQQGAQTHCHLFQQRFLPRTKSSNGRGHGTTFQFRLKGWRRFSVIGHYKSVVRRRLILSLLLPS